MARKLKNIELQRLDVDDFRISPKLPLKLALDNVRSMNNVGSVFRTSDAFRVDEIILGGITPAPPHRDIYKTALGAENSVQWSKTEDLVSEIRALKEKGWKILALEQCEGSISLEDLVPDDFFPAVLILGNEIDGVSEDVLLLCDQCVEIPQYGTKHSLNVSVSAGIAIWQLGAAYARRHFS